jgi:hypothetical protein
MWRAAEAFQPMAQPLSREIVRAWTEAGAHRNRAQAIGTGSSHAARVDRRTRARYARRCAANEGIRGRSSSNRADGVVEEVGGSGRDGAADPGDERPAAAARLRVNTFQSFEDTTKRLLT